MLKLNDIILRAFEPRDLEPLLAVHNTLDLELASQSTPPRPHALAEFAERLEAGHLAVSSGGDHDVEFVMARVDDPELCMIGIAGLYEIDLHNRHAEIGVTITAPADRGLGMGIDAYALLAIYGLRLRGLNKVYGQIKSSNAEALGTLHRIGLDATAVLRQHRWVDGEWIDLHIFELLAADWRDRFAAWRKTSPDQLLAKAAVEADGELLAHAA